jgi:hypothetical protein
MSDINGGAGFPNANGSPLLPGTSFAGPLIAGNILHSDGSGTLAGLGNTANGTANAGYAVMVQSAVVTQATNSGVAGVFNSTIVIPAQSQILDIHFMVTTVWSGASPNFSVGTTAGTTAATSLTANTNTGVALGKLVFSPTTAAQIANWDNVSNATFQAGGPVDVQIQVASANTGTGVGTLSVIYVQSINLAS